MNRLLTVIVVIAALLASAPAQSQPTPTAGAATPGAMPAAAGAAHAMGMPAIHHLVYQFGYNTKAAASGPSTGKTTIDIVGMASDGGMNVHATDDWWNSVNPKQTADCEVYANGNVACSKPPYNLTGIQVSVLPYLGQNMFTALATNKNATWKVNYTVKATFTPGIKRGFGGQVTTWNCALTLTGKGVMKEQPPLILVHAEGQLAQQGGRYVKINQKANILFDPRLKLPVLVNNLSVFVPQQSTASYSVDLNLVKYQ